MKSCPGIPLPPQPIVTRWGTWIEAAIYYANYFDSIRSVIDSFDADDALSIRAAQEQLASSDIKKELAFIKRNYTCIPEALNRIQSQGVSLFDALQAFSEIRDRFDNAMHDTVNRKFQDLLRKNEGLSILKNISNLIHDDNTDMNAACDFIEKLLPNELNAYAYAPVTSCDVERTFSSYKHILSDRRHRFTFENLKMHVIINCNDVLMR